MSLLVLILVLLQIADGATTAIGLSKGATEANPLVASLMQSIGTVPALLLIKTAAAVITLWGAFNWPWVSPVFFLGYGYVIWNNLNVIRAQR